MTTETQTPPADTSDSTDQADNVHDAAPAANPDQWECDAWVKSIFEAEQIDATDRERYADWYGNHLLALDAEEHRVKLQHEVRVRQIDARRKALVAHHLPKVQEAVATLLATQSGKGKPKKSISLTSATLGFRTSAVTAEFESTEAVKRLAEEFPPAAAVYAEETKIVPKVDKRALVAAVQEYAKEHQGELPNGIILAGGGDKFYVKAP